MILYRVKYMEIGFVMEPMILAPEATSRGFGEISWEGFDCISCHNLAEQILMKTVFNTEVFIHQECFCIIWMMMLFREQFEKSKMSTLCGVLKKMVVACSKPSSVHMHEVVGAVTFKSNNARSQYEGLLSSCWCAMLCARFRFARTISLCCQILKNWCTKRCTESLPEFVWIQERKSTAAKAQVLIRFIKPSHLPTCQLESTLIYFASLWGHLGHGFLGHPAKLGESRFAHFVFLGFTVGLPFLHVS